MDTEGHAILDGIHAGGFFCRAGLTKEWKCSDYHISPTTIRKFGFSPIRFTGLLCPHIC
jgi:hypothetical protein